MPGEKGQENRHNDVGASNAWEGENEAIEFLTRNISLFGQSLL